MSLTDVDKLAGPPPIGVRYVRTCSGGVDHHGVFDHEPSSGFSFDKTMFVWVCTFCRKLLSIMQDDGVGAVWWVTVEPYVIIEAEDPPKLRGRP